MCLQCSNHCPEQENEPSKDELCTFFRAAYEQYQSEIVNDSKLYDRYVNDFISYHLPVFSQEEESIRNHFSNLFSIYELLTTRKDLVEKFFKLPEFGKKDFLEMVHSFNHIEYVVETPHSLATFNENQIRLITQFANESNFFVDTVDERTVDLFFRCKLKRPLVVQNMRHVLQFMFALSMQKMIPHNWVSLIADNKLLSPQKTMKPSSRGAISSRLTELRASTQPFPNEAYSNLVNQLKEMQ